MKDGLPLPVLVSITAASALVVLMLFAKVSRDQDQREVSPSMSSPPVRQAIAQTPTAPATGETQIWYSPDSTFTECNETQGPVARLEALSGAVSARTRDFKDAYGRLAKVEVIIDIGFGQQAVNTYYRDKASCEAGEVNPYRNLADKYR